MGSGLNKTKRRIASVTSTQKITKAMEMVATVKLKRFKDTFEHGSYYLRELEGIFARALALCPSLPYAKENEGVDAICYLLVTSNLGLCGGYNSELFRVVESKIRKGVDTLIVLGEKGKAHYSHDGAFHLEETSLDLNASPLDCTKAGKKLLEDFTKKKYKRIEVISTHYVNSLRFVPECFTLLPISPSYHEEPYESYAPPLWEPNPKEFVENNLASYLGAELYSRIGEAELSEQASRRNAMESANDNADELLDKLRIEYNKARQASITQEITEVVNGANSQTE